MVQQLHPPSPKQNNIAIWVWGRWCFHQSNYKMCLFLLSMLPFFIFMMIFYRQVLFVLLFIFLSHSYPFNFPSQVSFLADPNSRRSCLCSIFPTASLLCLVFFIGSAFIAPDYKEVVAIICFTLNIFFFFLFSFFFFQVSFRPFTVIQYFLKRLLVVQKLSIWGLGGSLQNSAVSNCGVCSSSLRDFVHQFVCVCVCVCVCFTSVILYHSCIWNFWDL